MVVEPASGPLAGLVTCVVGRNRSKSAAGDINDLDGPIKRTVAAVSAAERGDDMSKIWRKDR
jgi:hypothetical protein